jgi:hypothetical protein
MLSALILENFKAFGGRRTIPIRPLTLIFGPNSAGKSAILQSLLLLKQTMESSASYAPLQPRGELVDLGTFDDMLHRHDRDRVMEICPLFSMPGDESPFSVFDTNTITSVCEPPYGMGIRIQSGPDGGMAVKDVTFYASEHGQPAFRLSSSEDAMAPSYPYGPTKEVFVRQQGPTGGGNFETLPRDPWLPAAPTAIYLDTIQVDYHSKAWDAFIDWMLGDQREEDESGIVRDLLPSGVSGSKLLLRGLDVSAAHD